VVCGEARHYPCARLIQKEEMKNQGTKKPGDQEPQKLLAGKGTGFFVGYTSHAVSFSICSKQELKEFLVRHITNLP
jgi:hypothetical protein